MKTHYEKGGFGDVTVKKYLNEILQEFLSPIRKKRELLQKNIEKVYKVAYDGTERAKISTTKTLNNVKKAMKIDYKNII